MKNKALALVVLLAAVVVACYGIRAARMHSQQAARPIAAAPEGSMGPMEPIDPRFALDDEHYVGAPLAFAPALTVFPVYARHQVDLGPFTTLDEALVKKDAEVRELGADGGGSAQVNRLTIENKGDVPIFVLAGTVVKGGRQDRQIGQDFIIGAHDTVNVDAFCVEQGRWNGERNGVSTKGRFGAMKTLANSSVRAAGQYKQSQGEVWAKVGEVNAANKKAAASGTLMATFDDADVAKRRADVAKGVESGLGKVDRSSDVVGIAYAVDGKVRGVRWFANRKLFDLHRTTLVNTAAVEAITAEGRGGSNGEPVPREAVKSFVAEVEQAKEKGARTTEGANVNEYRESQGGYGSRTTLKPAATAPGAAAPKPAVKVSSDFVAK